MPGMNYALSDKLVYDGTIGTAARATAAILEAATGAITGFLWDVNTPMEVVRLCTKVTVAFDYNVQTVEGILTFYKRITYASDTGRVTLGNVRLIHGTPIGAVLYVDINPHKCLVGEQIIAEISVAGVGGTEVGDHAPFFEAVHVPEQVGNMPMMVLAS